MMNPFLTPGDIPCYSSSFPSFATSSFDQINPSTLALLLFSLAVVQLKKRLQNRHVQYLQDIFELKIMCLSVEPLNQFVPRIIQIKRLSSFQKPFCFWVSKLAGKYNTPLPHHIVTLCSCPSCFTCLMTPKHT